VTDSADAAVAEVLDRCSQSVGSIHGGIDRVELEEFRRIVGTAGAPFLASVYTPGEREHCGDLIEKLATRFAAKEATTKVLGTGIRGISLREIEVVTMPSGQPTLRLHDRAQSRAVAMGITSISVSLTHTSAVAEALVVALASEPVTHAMTPEEKRQ
jgi:holo-[acyl-carrier protein] synthase